MEIKDVENLAELARIELSEEEKKKLLPDLEAILGYVRQVEAAELKNTKPDFKRKNIWREDELVAREYSMQLITNQFPDSQDGFLKVKKIL